MRLRHHSAHFALPKSRYGHAISAETRCNSAPLAMRFSPYRKSLIISKFTKRIFALHPLNRCHSQCEALKEGQEVEGKSVLQFYWLPNYLQPSSSHAFHRSQPWPNVPRSWRTINHRGVRKPCLKEPRQAGVRAHWRWHIFGHRRKILPR